MIPKKVTHDGSGARPLTPDIAQVHEFKGEIEVIRSSRKTVALQIKADGSVILRAPRRMKSADIDNFRVFPEYWKWNKWLKENGKLLMARMVSE